MQKRFLTTILVALITSTVIAGLLYKMFTAGLLRADKDFQGKLNYMVQGKGHYDLVFIGASRVNNGVNAALFDSLTSVNSYNAGMEGANIAEIKIFLNKYIRNHGAPKYLILGMEETLLQTSNVWDFPRFFPYVQEDDVFSLYVHEREILLARYFPPLALTYYDDSRKSLAMQSLLHSGQTPPAAVNRGYKAMPHQSLPNLQPISSEYYSYNQEGLDLLNDICKMCNDKNIKVIFLLPPKLITAAQVGTTAPTFQKIQDIATVYKIPVIDLSHRKEFTDARLFYDGVHLIDDGANLYTTMIAQEFKKLY